MGLLQDLGEWFDDTSVGTWIDAVGSDFNRVRQSEQLDDILQDLHGDKPLTGNQYYEKQKEYRDKFFEREAENENYTQAHNKLVRNDSFLQNLDQMGGTLEGMAAQAAGTLGGAVVGGLAAPFTAGASAVGGAKIGNAVGAVAGGYFDARSVAIQAREDVLDRGGSWEQAKKAYDEALFKASFTTLPETLLDIAMGNRIVSSAAKNIGKSAVGKVGSTILDPASKVGTFVADKTAKSLIGRGAGLLTDVAMQGATEAVQEVTQDYIADREVAKAMGDADNEYSLGGFKDYMFSPQGLETMKTAGIMGALFGGAGGAISSGQYLKYATNDNAAMARINQLKDYNDKTGKLKIFSDKEAQDNFIQDVANIFNIDKEDIPSFRDALRMYINYDTEYWNVGIADRQVLNTAATNDLIQKLSGDASNRRDITSETTRDFFNFVGEDTAIDVLDKYRADVLEKAKTEGQAKIGTETTTEQGDVTGESQPQTKIKATPGLGQQVAGETNPQPYTKTRTETGQAEPSGTPQTTSNPATQKAVFKQSIGKFNKTVEGEGNITYDNGSRSIRLTQMDDGRFNVMDEHNLERGGKVFNTQDEAESFIQKIDEGTATWDDGTRFQGQSKNNAVVEQPNTSDGVISERHESDKASGKKQIIHTADDLRKYFASRKGTPLQMDGRMYFEMMRAIERFGSENLGFNMAEGLGIVDGSAIPGKIDKIRDERGAVTGALITLYRGADAMTALHEIGHFGYWKMSEAEKQQFNEWAIKTESAFLARLLNREYNQQFRNELIVALQTKQGDLWDRIQSEGVMYQTVDMLNNQRSSDLSQIACEERFAWEFSMWYAQGYTKGLQPNNFIQLILDRICGTLENALSLVSDTAEFLKSNGYENIQMGENVKSPLRMFEEMRTNDRPVAQEKQKTETEQPKEQPVEQPTQEPTQEQEETPLEERHVSAIEPDINTSEESRFMYGARGALNSPLNEIVSGKKTTREQQLEKDYTKLFYSLGKSLGYSQEYLDDIFNKYGRISLNKIIDYKNNKKARVFKEINDTVNERIWKGTAKVKGVDFQRGLDGRWRFYFRDNLMHVKPGITKKLVSSPNDLIRRPMKLSDVIKHDILFKYYPTLKDIDVVFDTEKNNSELKDTYAWFDDKLNRIVINYDVLQKEDMKEHVVNGKKYSSMDTNQLERTILHELQHAIQGYEGLAMGGDEGDFTLVSSEYRNFASMLRKKKKEFINYIVKDSGFGFSEKAAESIVNQIFSDKNLRTRMDVLFNLKIQSPGFIEDELLFGFVEKDNLLFDRYYSLLGEIEARDAEKRKNMTEQRWREVAPNNGIGAYTNGLAPITVRDAYVSPAKTEQQRLDEQQAKQQQQPEQKKGERKPSIESVQGLINFAKAVGMSQEQIEQMILNESPNGKEIVEMMRNEQNKQKKKSDTRFMSIGKKAINSPVQNTFKLEMDYLRRYSKLGKQFGYSAFDIHQSYQLFGRDWDSKTVNPQNNQFAEIFIKINDEINNQLWKEGKSVQRGVDGRWRYYINDNKLTVSGDDKFWNGIKNVLQTREFPLASLIKHPELYNYYPDMKGTSIVFSDLLPNDVEAAVMQLTNGKIGIVVNYNSLQKNKSVDAKKKWFARLMLHEMQHIVQDKEGFARGGSTTEFSHIPNATDRYREYAQLLGEIEARDTSQRYGLTEEQWNRTKPLDYDFRYRQAVTRRGKINVRDVGAGNNLRTSNFEMNEKAEEGKQILDKAFPDTRFQFAWHSTPYDFNEFTFEHLLKGTGSMVHGWGLYFSKNLYKNKRTYFDELYNEEKGDPSKRRIYVNGIDYTNKIKNVLDNDKISHLNTKDDILKELMEAETIYNRSLKEYLKNYPNSRESIEQDFNNEIKKINDIANDIIKYGVKIDNISKSRLLLVDIPENSVMLHEKEKFEDQPKSVQIALIKALNYLNEENNSNTYSVNWIKHLNGREIYNTFEDIVYGNNPIGDGWEEKLLYSQMVVSKTLNKFGIKGIFYKGMGDGECFVVFDNKAIDILSKFQKEENKWKKTRVENKTELTDKQKQRIERKLKEKSDTRFQSGNRNLNQAKANKNDEFYTRMGDIEKELSNYKEQFKDKVIYCNCDDPQSSNFWKYFVDNFDGLGIKKVISTHYDANGSYKLEYDGQNTKRTDLKGDGDFRSQESLDTLKNADIVVSNPPFSLFRQYVKQLVDNDKQFLIVGNKNAMTSKEMFPLIKDGNVKLGNNNVHRFNTPDGQVKHFGNIGWFTNLATNKQTKEQEYTQRYYDDNGKPLPNVEQKYPKFDGTDIINVNRVADIPVDYDGVMGVPISFMDNYTESSPFEIVGTVNHGTDGEWDLAKSMVGGKEKFKRIAIKRKGLSKADTRFQKAINKEIENADNILDRKSTGDTRFMGVGRKATGSKLKDQSVIDSLNKEYNDILLKLGIPQNVIDEFIEPKNRTFGTFNQKTLDFIRGHNKANEVLWKKGFYRGLDGHWRYWIDDRKSNMVDSVIDSVINGNVDRDFKLKDVLSHKELFNAYTDIFGKNRGLENLPVKFVTSSVLHGAQAGFDSVHQILYVDRNQIYKDGNVYRIGSRTKQALEKQQLLQSVILHEIQHCIQRYEGFAAGGNNENSASFKRSGMGNEENVIIQFFNANVEKISKMLAHNQPALVSFLRHCGLKIPKQLSNETNEQYKRRIQQTIEKHLEFMHNNQEIEDALYDYINNERSIFNHFFGSAPQTTNGKILQFFIEDPHGKLRSVDWNLPFRIYQSMLGEIEARDTMERFVDEKRNQSVPFNQERVYSGLTNRDVGDFVVVEGMPGVSSDRKMRGRQKFDPLPTKEEREKLKENVKSNKEQKPITDVVKEKMDVANSIIADTLQKIKDGQKIDRGEIQRMFFDDDKEHLNNLIEAILSYYETTKEAPKNLSVRNDIDWLKTTISNNGQLMGDLDYEPLIDRLQAILDSSPVTPTPNANPVVQPQTPQTPSPTQKPTSKPGRQIGGTQKKPTVLTPKNPGKVQQPTRQTPAATPKQPVKTGLTAGEKQKKKEATAEETKKKVIEARKKGEVTDIYKDVYSVSFDKSAQSNEENQRKMRYFEQRLNFWDKTVDKDGKITYTRKVPYQSHQKIINYSGINGIEKLNKPKKKWEEWKDWAKDTLIKYLFNDKHYLAKVARKYDMWDTYVKLVVMKDYSLRANVALTEGIMYNGKRTRALNDIIKEIGEEKQKLFIDYCIAFRIKDLSQHKYWEKKPKLNAKGEYEKDTNGNIVWEEVELTKEILQKMSKKEANQIIADVQNSADAKLFEKCRKDFVKYNHALLHVLVDGGIMSEDSFNKFVKSDPNFVPLSKVMDDTDFSFNAIVNANSLVNINTPIKKIGTSMREVANPFMEMQKRTAEYYSIAARNRAGQIFVNEIAGKIDYLASGDVVQRGQGLLRKVKVDQRNGKLLTRPSDRDQIIYVCNNGEHEFYQIADKEIYLALKSLDADQMGTIQKMLDKVAHVPSGLVRNTATMVPDFGFRNLFRDNVEAFLTSEHGFIPFVDAIWGMYQMANNTEWYQRYLEQNGEYGTLNRDNGRVDDIARIEDIIEDKINPLRNWNEIRKANMAIMRDTQKAWIDMKNIKSGDFGKAWENTRNGRLFSLMKLAVSPVWAIGKSNKRLNDYLEIGTRIGEFKNAKMGYSGLLDRLAKVGIDTNLANAVMNDIYAAGVSKDITLNFGQHGVLGKALNRYIPFFNASLQGIYKLLNTWDLMLTGTTMSGKKNHSLQAELIFKTALISAFAIGIAAAGDGDEDYEEAPDYEKENFWIFPNGIRIPKDQVLGKMIGNSVEKSYSQWKKGKAEPIDILKNIAESFAPDKVMPAIFDMAIGGLGNYDTFYKQAIVPEYMADKLGYLQKDIRTSNFSADVTEALWKTFGINVSAKKLDWAIQKQLTNLGKYLTTVYDAGKQGFNPQDFNERIARGYDKNDSTGAFVGGLKDDVWKPLNLITGTFATNRTQYKSISDFYANYNKYKKLSSDEERMTTEQKKTWKRYQEAYKKDKVFRKELRAIKSNKAFSGKEKRERADKIFKQQIKLAKWAEG